MDNQDNSIHRQKVTDFWACVLVALIFGLLVNFGFVAL